MIAASAAPYMPSSEDFFENELSLPSSIKGFAFAQLEAAAKGFALEAKVGVGSFGTVYRGNLPDGREVAIKRGEPGPRARLFQERAFRSELAFLSRYNHRHISSLVGYCEDNEERLLVYEYMNNGSLYDHLHPKEATPSSPSPVASSWKLRIRILLDASRGIEYLHSHADADEPPIIHGNIKSSKILLDAGWTARVSGSGSGMQRQEAHAHLAVKDDVYAFGVVMLEVLTGKRAVFEEADEGSNPVSVLDYYGVPMMVSGELGKVLDPRAPEPAAHEAEALGLVAYAALHCVSALRGDL